MSVGVAIGLDVSGCCDWDKCLLKSVSESLVSCLHDRECIIMDPPAHNNEREHERRGVWFVVGASQSRVDACSGDLRCRIRNVFCTQRSKVLAMQWCFFSFFSVVYGHM
jgi:hypothetical protein